MKKYNFLLKPIFFIFNLLFATWLVIEIETISPSDFGNHKSLVKKPYDLKENHDSLKGRLNEERMKYLKNLFNSYKTGLIDSVKLEEKLTIFLNSEKNNSAN